MKYLVNPPEKILKEKKPKIITQNPKIIDIIEKKPKIITPNINIKNYQKL